MTSDASRTAEWAVDQAGAARHTAEQALALAREQAVTLARIEERQEASNTLLHTEVKTLARNIEDGISGVHRRLDRLNGQTAANTDWRVSHQQKHEVADRVKEAALALRRRDWAFLGGMLTAAGVLSGIIFRLFEVL